MKRQFALLSAVAALIAVSCQTKEEDAVPQEPGTVGVPMSLTASLDSDSKATYALEGGLLKATWDANETISIVTYTKSSTVIIDNFTYSGEAGQTSVTFNGTFNGGNPEDRWGVYCVYPALTENGNTQSPANAEGLKAVYNEGLIFYSDYLKASSNFVQPGNGDFSLIADGSMLWGIAEMAGNSFTTTLAQVLSVMKVSFVMPAAFNPSDLDMISYASIESTDSGDNSVNRFWNGAIGYNGNFSASARTSELKVNFDSFMLDRQELVVYFPFRAEAFSAGDKLVFKVHNSTEGEDYTATRTLSSDFTFEPGKQYNMTINLVSTASPTPPAATNLSPNNQTANCYVIASDTPGIYKFKNCKGTSYNYNNVTAETAEVLWESLPSGLSTPSAGDIIDVTGGEILGGIGLYDDGYVYFKTTGARGNAVIAVKDGSGNILWSWHIWCTGSAFNPTTDYFYGGVMRVNLGAFSYDVANYNGDIGRDEPIGLLYQYGRKDPFRGINNLYADNDPLQQKTTNSANWNAVDCTAETGTVAYAHAHPMTFINPNFTSGWGNGDWVYTESNLISEPDRWGNSNDDPCPYGWRVMRNYNGYTTAGQTIYEYLDKRSGVWFDFPYPAPYNDALAYPFSGYIREGGIPIQRLYTSNGGPFRFAGFYWAASGGSNTSRQYMTVEDEVSYTEGGSGIVEYGAHGSGPRVSVRQTEDSVLYDTTKIGPGSALSVRCVKYNE